MHNVNVTISICLGQFDYYVNSMDLEWVAAFLLRCVNLK